MKTSEQINDLSKRLADAQAGQKPDVEAEIVRKLIIAMREEERNKRTPLSRLLSKVAFGLSDCWVFTGSRHHLGYGIFHALGESKAHRVSYRIFKGDIQPGMQVMHTCDVRLCVNPEHLELGTHTDNMRDMVRKGRHVAPRMNGENNPGARLTPDKVKQMRAERSSGKTFKEIAADFGVSPMTALRAIKGQSWRTVR